MSDRKSPSSSRREADDFYAEPAHGERQAYAEDPLVELARIVSESAHTQPVTPGYEGVPEPRDRPAPVPEPQDYTLPDDFGSDLEAELMAELAPIYTPQAEDAPQPQPRPQVPAAQPQSVRPAPQFSRATPSMPPYVPQDFPQNAAPQAYVQQPHAYEEPVPPLEPDFDPLAYSGPQPDPLENSALEADAAAAELEAALQEELRLASFGTDDFDGGDFDGGVSDGGDDFAPDVEQPHAAPNFYEAAPAAYHGSVEQDYADPYPPEPEVYRGAEDPVFAPVPPVAPPVVAPAPRAPEPSAPVPMTSGHIEPNFDVDDMQWPAAEQAVDLDAVRDEPRFAPEEDDDDFALDDLFEAENDAAPGVAPAGVLPEHPKAEQRAAPHAEPKRRGLLVAGVVGGLVVVGGAVFLLGGSLLSGGPSGPPVRIAAQAGPFKEFPETTSAPSEAGPSKAIYDRVAGVQSPRDEQLVPREEQPIATLPTTGDGDTRMISGNEGGTAATPARPKRVRTVVVRPDGTIINAPDLPTTTDGADATTAAPTDPAEPPTFQPTQDAPTDIRTVATTPVDSAPVNGATTATSEDPRVPSAGEPGTAGGANAATADESLLPRPKPAEAPTRVAAAPASTTASDNAPIQRSGPLDLTQGASGTGAASPAPAATQPAAQPRRTANIPSGSYVVQVSSQRTLEQAQAAYASMQRQFPSILGNVEAAYPSVNLGDRGTFYRVRIIADGQADANNLCTNLKAAGGDCFVRRSE